MADTIITEHLSRITKITEDRLGDLLATTTCMTAAVEYSHQLGAPLAMADIGRALTLLREELEVALDHIQSEATAALKHLAGQENGQ